MNGLAAPLFHDRTNGMPEDPIVSELCAASASLVLADVALFKFGAHVRCRHAIVESVVDDGCGQSGQVSVGHSIGKRARHYDLRSRGLEPVRDIESDKGLVRRTITGSQASGWGLN